MLKKLYIKYLYRKIDNNFIYEVTRNNNDIVLHGPIESNTIRILSKKFRGTPPYNFVYAKVIDGQIVAFLAENDLFFSNRRL